MLYVEEQSLAEYAALSGQSFLQTASAAARDTRDYLLDNPFLLVLLAALAVVFFAATRPRVR